MSDNRIRMTFTQPMNQWLEVPTPAYNFKPVRWVWLANLCWRVLGKIKALSPHFDKQMMVTSIVIDPDQAAKKILEMAVPAMSKMSGQWPERVLIGQRQFKELHSSEEQMWRPFYFEVPVSHAGPPDPYDKYQIPKVSIFNLKVCVIPWMDGVLVL